MTDTDCGQIFDKKGGYDDEKVLNFIERFTQKQESSGYWFSYVLFSRFIRDGAVIMYARTNCRFATKIGERVYDVSGDVTVECDWEPWFELNESELRESVIKSEVMF